MSGFAESATTGLRRPLGAYLHPDPLSSSSLEAQRREWAACGYKGLARGAAALGGRMLTTEESFDGPVELTLEQVVTLRRPAWTSSEQQDGIEFYFDVVHFWLTRPDRAPQPQTPDSGKVPQLTVVRESLFMTGRRSVGSVNSVAWVARCRIAGHGRHSA